MKIQESVVHCASCKNEWLAQFVIEAPISVWTASVHAIQCPECGAGVKKINFGRGHVPDPEPLWEGLTDAERRAEWLALHDNGLSSECIADKMCGMTPTGCYP